MTEIIVYDERDGRIKRNVICPTNMVDIQIGIGESYIVGQADPNLQYIDTSDKKAMYKSELMVEIDKVEIISDGIDTAIISDLPDPSIVIVNDIYIYEVTDGSFEFTIDTPGEYKIKCSAFPFLDKEFVINAS